MSLQCTWVGVSYGAVSRVQGGTAAKRSQYQADAASARASDSPADGPGSRDPIGHWLLLPDDAPSWASDRAELWARAGQAERRYDAQEARILDVTWPRQLPLTAVPEAVGLIFGRFREVGLAVQVDLHVKAARDGLPNPHIHGLISTRVTARTRSP